MNKTDLVKKIAAAAGISAEKAKVAVDAATSAIKEAVVAGEKVQLIGFGTFALKERPARQGVNPHTGAKIEIPAKKVVKFNAGAEFEEALNK